MNGEPAVVAAGLRKRYGDVMAVDRISFEVRRGEIFGMVGPNGAGLDCRFGWRPEVAAWLQVAAFVAYALGWALHLWAMAANRYHALVVRTPSASPTAGRRW